MTAAAACEDCGLCPPVGICSMRSTLSLSSLNGMHRIHHNRYPGISVQHQAATGLFPATVDRAVLGISEAEAKAWEDKTGREFELWAKSKHCDSTKISFPYSSAEDLHSCRMNTDCKPCRILSCGYASRKA